MMALLSCAFALAATVSSASALHILGSTAHGPVQIDAWGADSLRVRFAPVGGSIVDVPRVQALLPLAPPPLPGAAHETLESVVNGNLRGDVDPASGFFTLTRVSDGAVLLQQTSVTWGAPAAGAVAGSASMVSTYAGFASGERVFGLGEHPVSGCVACASFASNWGTENNGVLTIAFFASSRGYGVLSNHAGYGSVNLSTAAQEWRLDATLQGDIWVTAPAPAAQPLAAVYARYADVVGHAVPMPWSLTGFVQSKNRYRSQAQLLGVAREFATRGLPLAVIVIDYLSWVTLGDDTLNPACWPSPQSMVDELLAQNVSLLISFYPYFNRGSSLYSTFVPALTAIDIRGGHDNYNGCLGGQNVYDPFNSDARTAMYAAWTRGYGRYGLSNTSSPSSSALSISSWQDCSEPGRDDRLNGRWRGAAGMDSEVGAAWPREHARTMAEGNAAAGLSDAWILTRSFYPGSNAHGVVLWSGDVQTTFESLWQQVRVAQSAAMSGVALWASDTGGYLGGNITDPTYRELVVRWTQFSAVTGIMRFHGKRVGGDPPDACGPTNNDNEPWSYGEVALVAITAAMRLRESLRGYIADANGVTVETGLPILRPLAFDFPEDVGAVELFAEGGYVFGPRLLAWPVTSYGARETTVYLPRLPAGEVWRGFWFHNATYGVGGVNVTVSTPLEEFPLFERVQQS